MVQSDYRPADALPPQPVVRDVSESLEADELGRGEVGIEHGNSPELAQMDFPRAASCVCFPGRPSHTPSSIGLCSSTISYFYNESSTHRLLIFSLLFVTVITPYIAVGIQDIVINFSLFANVAAGVICIAAITLLYLFFVFIPARNEGAAVRQGTPSRYLWSSCYVCAMVGVLLSTIIGVKFGLTIVFHFDVGNCDAIITQLDQYFMAPLIFVFLLCISVVAFGASTFVFTLVYIESLSCNERCCGNSERHVSEYDTVAVEMDELAEDMEDLAEDMEELIGGDTIRTGGIFKSSSILYPPLYIFSRMGAICLVILVVLVLYNLVALVPRILACFHFPFAHNNWK